jgi:hypothetical protein
MFLEKLDYTSDHNRMMSEANDIITNVTWNNGNQIGLNRRDNSTENIWKDATGSLYDREHNIYIGKEKDFTVWNIDSDSYIRQQIENMMEGIVNGRVRLMNLTPKKGLSVHKDLEVRYHYVLKTNKKSYICHNPSRSSQVDDNIPISAFCYHMPMDNHWYKVDTRETHWVYNGGETDRVHLVVCGT